MTHPAALLGPPQTCAGLAAAGYLTVPSAPGLACVLDAQGAPVMLATTGDLRRWARDRLDPAPDDPRRRTDLASVAAALRWARVGSDLEADWLYLELARALTPATYRAAADRWQAWFVRLDPADAAPAWRKGRLEEFAGADPATLIGPMRDKDAAGRFGEVLDDAFDLCRYPRELALAPAGTPCAYKQMGRCPAPCDGTEPMDRFRDRVRAALEYASNPPAWCDRVEAQMRSAAAAQDFESAAERKAHLERARAGLHRAFAHAGRLDRARWAFLGPGEKRGWVRVVRVEPGAITAIADVDAADEGAVLALLERLAAAPPMARPFDRPACEVAGLIAHALYHRPARARGGFVTLRGAVDADRVRALLGSAARTAEQDAEPITDRETAP